MLPSPRRRPAGLAALSLAAVGALGAIGILVLLGFASCGGRGGAHRRARPPAVVPAALGRPAIDWVRGAAPGERVVIGEGGVAVGAAGAAGGASPGEAAEPLVRTAFDRPEEADDLRFFAATFAPFAAVAAGERFAFAGRGATAPSPAERRMIREWARKTAAETALGEGGDGASYGLALAWRGGPLACDGLSVFLSGEVRAGNCDWRQEVRGRLAAEPLARLYRWFDAYRPFQVDSLDTGRATLAASGITFAGGGASGPAPPEARAAIGDFAAALFRELAARRAASMPPKPASPAPGALPGATVPPAAPAPAPTPVAGLLRSDLPPPAPPTIEITPLAPPAGPPPGSAPAIAAAEATVHAALRPPAVKAPPPAREEEDEAPAEGTDPGGGD